MKEGSGGHEGKEEEEGQGLGLGKGEGEGDGLERGKEGWLEVGSVVDLEVFM